MITTQKQVIFKGKTQYFKNFEIIKKNDKIIMSGVGSTDDMSTYDYKIYTKIIELDHPPKKALFLGGGALVAPRYFLHRYPSCFINVVEADKEIIRLAKQYMNVENVSITHGMGRWYLDKQTASGKLTDLIFLDVTMGAMHHPNEKEGRILFSSMLEAQELYLYTQESFGKLAALLNPKGSLIVNHIGTPAGEKSWIWQSSYQILKTLFRYVRVFPQQPTKVSKPQNILIVCSQEITALSSKKTINHAILSSSFNLESKKNLQLAFVDKWHQVKEKSHPILRDRHILSKRWHITHKK